MQGHRNTWGYGGGFTSVCDKIFDTLVLGILWLLCSLPLITIGASSTALYYAFVKCVRNSDGYAVQEFFKAFKRDFIKATILWVIIAAVSLIMQLNIGILMHKTSGYVGLFFICLYGMTAVFLIVMSCYMFSALSRYEMGTVWFLKISIYMTIRYFGTSIAILCMFLCFGILVWKVPMLLFVVPGVMVFMISEFMERVLKKHEPKKERGQYL